MYSSHSVYRGYTISPSTSRLSVETTNGETRLKDFTSPMLHVDTQVSALSSPSPSNVSTHALLMFNLLITSHINNL